MFFSLSISFLFGSLNVPKKLFRITKRAILRWNEQEQQSNKVKLSKSFKFKYIHTKTEYENSKKFCAKEHLTTLLKKQSYSSFLRISDEIVLSQKTFDFFCILFCWFENGVEFLKLIILAIKNRQKISHFSITLFSNIYSFLWALKSS